jgi:adenosylcobyric acid synthase
MLGREISDPDGIEGRPGAVPGLGLLDVSTVMTPDKRVTKTRAIHPASGTEVRGYEIHLGRTEGTDRARPLFTVGGEPEGAVRADGRVMGSYLHGIFTADTFRRAFLTRLGARPGAQGYDQTVEDTLDALADHLAAHVDCTRLLGLARG